MKELKESLNSLGKKIHYEPFTWDAYILYLNAAIESCYRFIGFDVISENFSLPDYHFVLLRHDVDYDPTWVLPISRIEAERGLQATYCFQIDSQFYRFESNETQSVIQEVINCGHYLGLHFDARQIADDKKITDMVEQFSGELEMRFKRSVSAVSFHMPTYRHVQHLKLNNNRVNTSSSLFFEKIEYVSDSNMDWRGKDILKIFYEKRFRRMQVLIHPFWWRKSYQSLSSKIEELASKLGISSDEILTKEQIMLIENKDCDDEDFIVGK
jgi:hypothetical protein